MVFKMQLLVLLFISYTLHFADPLDLSPIEQSIMNELSWGVKLQILKDFPAATSIRRVGFEALVDGRRQNPMLPKRPKQDADEDEIKIKLFRMMHESISDSDAKIKRAELIRKNYENSTSFDVGFIVGDVTDKYNTMMDISAMLERLSEEWKPIDHINAYEQIANKGIEISQLIELVKTITKKNKTAGYRRTFLNIRL